ncbi:MAG TPA: hypothetical protein VD994_21060, partial [Prosthecobacter sp.]|nr:hypothetical protein [Prosthecobacter sp.]
MSRQPFAFTVAAFAMAGLLISATPERRTRADLGAAPLRPGTKVEEQRRLVIDGGGYKVLGDSVDESLTLRLLQRVKLTRRIQSADNEDVTVEDFALDSAL